MRILATTFLVLVGILAGSVAATTFEPVSTAELAHRAVRVAAVRCVDCRATRDAQSGLVFTEIEFQLLEDLKGRSAKTRFRLRLAGGEADGVKTVVVGMPTFAPGGEYVVLLGKHNRSGYPTLVAARRGVVRLLRDKNGKRELKRHVTGFDDLTKQTTAHVSLASFRSALRKDTERRKAQKSKKPGKKSRKQTKENTAK